MSKGNGHRLADSESVPDKYVRQKRPCLNMVTTLPHSVGNYQGSR